MSLSSRPAITCCLIVAAIWGAAPAWGDASGPGESLTCAACTPERLVEQADRAVSEAMTFQLRAGELPADRPALFVVQAQTLAHLGRIEDALPVARRAAAECVLTGEEGCAETIHFLAELTLADGAGDDDLEDQALAYLSLLPYERLGSRHCVDAVVLRYRLSERRSPRAAEPEWADRCGGLGRIDEPGYRAAKAAVLQGDLDDAVKRLNHVRAFNYEYAVRATYLLAVVDVSRGHVNGARDAFADIVELGPSKYRSEEEDDARVLAALQLARLERERGNWDAALAAYRSIPSGSVPRKDALLEGAVTAAHVGDMGAAQNYLEGVAAYEPQVNQLLDVHRLKANLAILNEQDDDAVATFQELARLGREARSETFGPDKDPRAILAEDPTLNGLLDPYDARRLKAAELEVQKLTRLVTENRRDLAIVRDSLSDGGPDGPLKRALEKLEGADLLLRRAENIVSQREAEGIKLAGPADAALTTYRRAQAVRTRLNAARRHVATQHAAHRELIVARLTEVELDVQQAERRLIDLRSEADEVFDRRRDLLLQRAERVVVRLEMSEALGMAELAWQQKLRASLAVKRAHDEYNESSATLKSDSGRGTE